MKKFKTKNLFLTALAILCAVVLGCAVSLSVGLFNKSKTAHAAVDVPEVNFGTEKYYFGPQISNFVGQGYSYNSLTLGAWQSTAPSQISYTSSTNSASISMSVASGTSLLIVPLILSVDVPAYSIYTVEMTYQFTQVGRNGRAHGIPDTWSDDPTYDFNFDMYPISQKYFQPGVSGQCHGNPNPITANHGSHLTNNGFTFYNDTNTAKEMKAYSYYFYWVCDGQTSTFTYTGSIDFTNFDVTVEKIGEPTTTYTTPFTYDGTTKTFDFTYDKPTVTAYDGTTFAYEKAYENITATVDAVDYDGNTINASTYNLSSVGKNGTLTAKEAGKYKVKFNLKQDAKDGGVEWATGGTAEKTITFEIKRKGLAVPVIQNDTVTYKGAPYEFGMTGYDSTIMSVASYVSNNGSTITWDGTTKKFKATDAAEYTVAFHMDSINHVWLTDAGTESSTDQTKKITIEKKEITINTTPASGTNPSWGLGDTGDITINATATGIANPDFVLDIYYVKDGTTSPLTVGIDTTTNKLDVSQITSTGKYKLCIELTSASANNNYSITNGKFEMPFEIKSGGIDFSVINWQYSEAGGNMQDLFASGVQNVIRYKQDSTGAAVKYMIGAIIPAGGYLSIDTSYNANGYTNGFYTTKDGATYNSGCSAVGKYKTRIALKSDTNHLFKAGSNSGSFGGDDTSGWYEIEWEISKGKVDASYLSNLKDNLQYRTAGGAWQTYDPANPPQFGKGAIEIRLDPSKYPAGVTNASITVNDKNTAIGSYTAQVTLTYDPNYVNEGTQSFTWEISAQVIEVDWTSDFWKDGSGNNVLDSNNVPYQIKVLNIPESLKQYIEYKYYIADTSDPSIRGMYIGTGDQGLQDLTSPPYNASSTNAVYVYVEAVIKSGVTQYKLSDTTGNAYDCSILYRLGSTNTLVNVTQSVTEMEYGDGALTEGIFTLYDTGIGGDLDKTTYLDGIYVYDAKGTNLGLLSGFDGTKADAGLYTIEIKLNAAGENTYTLAPGSKYKFEIKPKAIDVPTVSEIVFDNTYINLADKLGGSYGTYKDIIKLGGTYDGVKNANTPYVATLTLTNANYCWSYPTTSTPSKHPARLTLTDGESYTVTGDETVATYNWKINPYVLSASGWNLKGKDGATYDIPAGLTEGLDVGINYAYRTDKASNPIEEVILKGGSTFFVTAQLTGADANNFVFEDSNATTSGFATYKIPQSGAMAAFGSIKDFMTKTWLGLPIWAWFLIGLAVLILLIIIIVVAAKRRKTKEERAEKKAAKQAAKEEAEARKEAERARLESEREAERMRLESQREIEKMRAEAEAAKAKAEAEAEIAKMRAQAQAQMAQPMPMQQQYAQQPQMQQYAQQQAMPQQMPQPVPQPQYVQQPVNNNELEEIKKQLRKLNAKVSRGQGFGGQQFAAPVQMPMMPMQMPMSAQAYPQYPYGGQGDGLTELKSELAAMRAEQHATRDAEIKAGQDLINAKMQTEFTKLRVPGYISQSAPNSHDGAISPAQFVQAAQQTGAPQTGIPAETVVAMLNAVMNGKLPAEKPQYEPVQVIEAETLPVTQPAVYPPDAVITTTTTVDTTKTVAKGAAENERGNRETFFDIDGFYDKYEGK